MRLTIRSFYLRRENIGSAYEIAVVFIFFPVSGYHSDGLHQGTNNMPVILQKKHLKSYLL